MVPASIRSNLAGLRRRERLLTFVWGVACWVSIALVLLVLCMFADWIIDRELDTPWLVRYAFVAVQIGVWFLAGCYFIIWPQIRWLSDEMLALWVEAKMPDFDHRLISAVQLNKKGARLDGMSAELVQIVTREAEKEARRSSFAGVADHRRFMWSIVLAAPVFLLFTVPILAFYDVSFVLLARQALADIEIPRSVKLTGNSPAVWPVGDTIPIRFRVTGEYDSEMVGRAFVTPGGRFEMTFIDEDHGGANFGVDLDPSNVPVTDRLSMAARLGDGRTRTATTMRLVHRPVITDSEIKAWLILPAYCDTRKNVKKVRYARPQPRGDVVGIPGSSVHVQFEVQSEIKKAWLQLRGRQVLEPGKSEIDAPLSEFDKGGKLPMRIVKAKRFDASVKEDIDIWLADAEFDLVEGLSAYEMMVEDEHGFTNKVKRRRSLYLGPEGSPTVALLKDTFDLGDGSSFDLEGLPVVLGRPIRVPYVCEGPYGLSAARVLYRVLKKHESGNEPPPEEDWSVLDLPEYQRKTGDEQFDMKSGIFKNMTFFNQVSFFLIPSEEPETVMGRTMGGGRYFLQTKGNALLNSKGQPVPLKAGDQIEYCVEVFAAEREPRTAIPSARSESRVSTIMEEKEFAAWMKLVGEEDARVRQLEKLQKAIFQRN